MIDSHCHIDFPEFDIDRAEVLQQAQESGVRAIIVPGVVQQQWQRVTDLCQSHPSQLTAPLTLYPALGLHPCFMDQHSATADVERALEQQLCDLRGTPNRVVAVGEIGLDYFSSIESKAQQIALFEMQLSLAKSYDLPVILHVRKAHDDVLKRLRTTQLSKGGVVHAYSGSEQQARQYLELGFVLGLGGSATYDRAKKLHRVIRQISCDDYVLETDAPDMPPSFARGCRNSPLNLPKIAEAIAAIRNEALANVIRSTTTNTCRIFDLEV